jgi:hypothetical protein
VELEPVFAGLAEGLGDKLRAEGRSANPDDKQVLELTAGAFKLTLVDLGREGLDLDEARLMASSISGSGALWGARSQ